MQSRQNYTVIGVFEDRSDADNALGDLNRAGFRSDQIGVATRTESAATAEVGEGSEAAEGAVTGAVTGLGLGALAGLGVLSGVIPIIGPAIAGGTLGVILSNAAAGAGITGLIGALIGAGVPEDEAAYYQNEFEAGRTIVTVNATDRLEEAEEILRRNDAYDMKRRVASAPPAAASDVRRVDMPVDIDDLASDRVRTTPDGREERLL